jgi:hypothetical protein
MRPSVDIGQASRSAYPTIARSQPSAADIVSASSPSLIVLSSAVSM